MHVRSIPDPDRQLMDVMATIASGQPHDVEFLFRIVDDYDQLVNHDNGSQGTLYSNSTLDGVIGTKSVNGYLRFLPKFTVTEAPNTTVVVVAITDIYSLRAEDNRAKWVQAQFYIKLRE